ncbi:hypothetical protein POPTR_001G062900v4 [Populus trichocarpa]|uniref:Uncharacterized protein n=1 Tax=Populus trichocarpa TaxID=3694 RepID=A0ACC0THD9_POPTR|nr:hypothetical protein BDE02_01G057700 [Populus trichocarpa]KAI9400990.1 hypothetical protein POPTR_001G062900v4 [Populus trichocarpa]
MAAFPYQHQHLAFLVDEFQPNPNTENDVSSLLQEQETIASGAIFSPNLTHEYLQESTLHAERILETIHGDENFSEKVHFTSTLNYSSAIVNHNSSSPSMVVGLDYSEEDQVTQVMTPTMGQMRKQSLPTKKVKKESKREKRNPKSSVSTNLERQRPTKRQKKAPPLEHPTGYVHVRARRGEATDSHSLAERVRRERISAKMKLLQSLVPGCDQELFSSELQLPSDLESGSSQLSPFVGTSDAPTSVLQPHLTKPATLKGHERLFSSVD